MTINELTKEIHDNAVAHGWWDEPRSFAEVMALCVSELAEALEEDRAGKPMVYCKCMENGEPCEGINCDYFETFATYPMFLKRYTKRGNTTTARYVESA